MDGMGIANYIQLAHVRVGTCNTFHQSAVCSVGVHHGAPMIPRRRLGEELKRLATADLAMFHDFSALNIPIFGIFWASDYF